MMNANRYEAIKASLLKDGVTNFQCREGNGSIMVTYGRVVLYYIFNGDTIVDVIVD